MHATTPNLSFVDKCLEITRGMFKENRERFLRIFHRALAEGVEGLDSSHVDSIHSPPQGHYALLVGNSVSYRNADTEHYFRQYSDFYYLTGYDRPDALLLIDISNAKFVLCVPTFDLKESIWSQAAMPIEEICKVYDIDEVKTIPWLKEQLQQLASTEVNVNKPELHVLSTELKKNEKLMDLLPELESIPTNDSMLPIVLQFSRNIKSEKELELMRYAAQVSAEAHCMLMKSVKSVKYEYQLESIFVHYCSMRGLRYQAYPTIVGAGRNSAILHYSRNSAPIQEGDLVLVDAGGEILNYAADITRTFPASGKFNDKQRRIYSMVLDIQKKLIENIKPGINFLSDLSTLCSKLVCEAGVQLGIFKGPIDELVKYRANLALMPHGLGHYVGQDVHDTTIYPKEPLKPGMVVTIEPGIYFNRAALELVLQNENCKPLIAVEEFAKWEDVGGVRIEDEVLVTPTGYEVLTAGVPKEIDVIEALMAGYQ